MSTSVPVVAMNAKLLFDVFTFLDQTIVFVNVILPVLSFGSNKKPQNVYLFNVNNDYRN